MAFLMGNFVHVTVAATKLHYRLFLIPWVRRNNFISCCAKARDYSSAFPVKYIPRGSSINEENVAASLPVRCLKKSHNGHELSVKAVVDFSKNLDEEVDGDFVALIDDFVEEPDKIVEDSSKKCSGMQSSDVEKSAIKLLGSRAYTALELKKKLQGKRFPIEIIDAVITDFQSRGLINDCLYAESYSRSRWSSSSWGPRRIRQALFKKGISQVDAEKAIKLVFENKSEEGEDEDEDKGIAMSKISIDQLYLQASKQWQRSSGASQETRKSRMVRWLQYRGFSWSVVAFVLKKLESGDR
ncbi:hypothetical protein ABFS82_13G155400 [Erythranthe guttata]|uniref:Regulatory protein RecX n=1 Tax=Erythranthe guttata TaxID=4155 RepID=A0A022QLY2_ERYGU|nr:PREDICTED: uncharacterized protein LOC105968613 [Erythranthe guttata]EYU27470.1 hypothetical protein MIMGU_mgv1a010925mg [Erythranthe guttata]|eukprot:XP_012848701.1 PREDICTED: uncharacterized protein LOC105968613 [Erythranthe guttata]